MIRTSHWQPWTRSSGSASCRTDRRRASGDAPLLSFGIVLLHRLVPLFLSALQQRVTIFRQNILLLDHFIHRVAVTLEIFLAAGVSLCNASTWIAVFLALFRCFCEGDVRCFKGDSLIWCANRRVTQVPASIGGEWHREFRRTNSVAFVSVFIHMRNEHWIGRPQDRRLGCDRVRPLWAEVQTIGDRYFVRFIDSRNLRKRIICQRNQRPIGNTRVAARGRWSIVTDPGIHVCDHGAPEIPDGKWTLGLLPEQVAAALGGRKWSREMLQTGEVIDADLVRDLHVSFAVRGRVNERCNSAPILVGSVREEDLRDRVFGASPVEQSCAGVRQRIAFRFISEGEDIGGKE